MNMSIVDPMNVIILYVFSTYANNCCVNSSRGRSRTLQGTRELTLNLTLGECACLYFVQVSVFSFVIHEVFVLPPLYNQPLLHTTEK